VSPTDTARTRLVSVVIPCFNAERFIGSAIQSVLQQDWPALEVIVVDDGSSDGSAELVRRMFPSVVLLQQANQGVAMARNHGIAQARGEWIAFLDADDYWLPGKLSAQMEALRAMPEARMAYAAWSVWESAAPGPDPRYVADLLQASADEARWRGPTGWIYSQLLLDCEVWTSTVLVQRTLLDEIGVFDPGLRIGEDYDLWLRAARVTPIIRVPRPLALYRQHPASITRSAPAQNYRALVVSRAIQRWGYTCEHGRSARRHDVGRALASSWSQHAAAHLAVGHTQVARAAVWRALRFDPRHRPAWKLLLKSFLPAVRPVAATDT